MEEFFDDLNEDKTENLPNNVKAVQITDIEKIMGMISRGVESNQYRLIQKALKYNVSIRKYVTVFQLKDLVYRHISEVCPTYATMNEFLALIPSNNTIVEVSSEGFPQAVFSLTAPLPENEVYVFTLIVSTLIREKMLTEAIAAADILIQRIQSINRRSLDVLASKAISYYALVHERGQSMDSIRPVLLSLFRTACIHQDEMCEAVLLNLILRNYLHFNMIEQAQTLSENSVFPENASNNQYCRYLYYIGRILSIRLEYSDAYQRLIMASRKAPTEGALGFVATVHKLMIIVKLLMGEIPERSLFNHPQLRKALKPYLALTVAVRDGDLVEFQNVMKVYDMVFKTDKNMMLVKRLGHNVLKTGLKKVSLSYSRISFADIAEKLHFSSPQSAEYLCAKAIRDGVIEATIDHENGWLLSNEQIDIYSTEEPQKALHKRIIFCMDVHNDAVKSMHYPPDAYKKSNKRDTADEEEEEKSIEELIREFGQDLD